MRILIVEDEIRIREGMVKLISQYTNHTVIGQAKNGKEGLELARLYHPDLIITDIRMPEIDGLEMLQQLQNEKINIRTVILSGYSEFEYAKQAINLGVKDYLLKPIGLEDVIKLLERMSQEIEHEISSEKVTCESLIRDIIWESRAINENIYAELTKLGHFKAEMNYSLFVGYIGNASDGYKEQFDERLETIGYQHSEDRIYHFFSNTMRQIVCLIGSHSRWAEWENYFQRRIVDSYSGKQQQAAWAVSHFNDITDLHLIYEQTKERLNYGLILGNDSLITKQQTSEVHFENYSYPSFLEESLKAAVWRSDEERICQCGKDFKHHMQSHYYRPEEIRSSYIKLITYLSHSIQEMNQSLFHEVEELYAVKKISEAYTRDEIEQIFNEFIRIIVNKKETKQDITNYTILKAINYIREHYSENISLEEVARKLDITPEYLSTLFNREVEINFTAFLKQFRLSHAKRLLKGTNLKIYEIAQQVGYNDSKYFMRVFKEEQGISPKEFRQQ